MLRFLDLGASFSRFGCFVLRSSFSSASFSKLPKTKPCFVTELFSARLPVKVFKTLNGRQSHILSKFHKIERF